MDTILITYIVSVLAIYPLINLREINALRFTSMIAIFFIAFDMGTAVIKSFTRKHFKFLNEKGFSQTNP